MRHQDHNLITDLRELGNDYHGMGNRPVCEHLRFLSDLVQRELLNQDGIDYVTRQCAAYKRDLLSLMAKEAI